MSSNERIAYFNGHFVPESQVLIPFRDRGFLLGDAVFDTARTFGGKVFRLREHIERLFRSLKYMDIDPGLTLDDFVSISEQVIERNRHFLSADDDYWITQRVTRGANVVGGDLWQSGAPTVIVECTPLPLKARAHLFRDGIDVLFPSMRRVAPDSLSPNVKSHNYLNLVLADREVRGHNPDAWAILLDSRGYLCEGIGSNVFIVRDGRLFTPKPQYVLAGVSRQTVLELAAELGIVAVEDDISPYDACNADEAFITSTSFCLCPIRSFNGKTLADTTIPGPVTRKLTEAFAQRVDFDFAAQYLRHCSQ
jgi:branched-chain amino acid aminotransferase